jgi:aminoglycoside 3-N-acetyltransferase
MAEVDTIQNIPFPRTRQSLASDLCALGLSSGMTVIVHSSLSSIGWVSGGSVAVVQALMDVLTPAGTLVMPTHTGDLSDPVFWQNPPVPETWWPIIRDTMPAFEPEVTPTRGMGRIVETFRTWPDVLRSSHPQVSFAAWGQHAEFITAQHELDNSLGERSPLARIYDRDGYVLLLGVGFSNNTSFHLGEYRAAGGRPIVQGASVIENGQRVWKIINDIDWDADCFEALGADFEHAYSVKIGQVGSAVTRLFAQRAAVDFAAQWIAKKRITCQAV